MLLPPGRQNVSDLITASNKTTTVRAADSIMKQGKQHGKEETCNNDKDDDRGDEHDD